LSIIKIKWWPELNFGDDNNNSEDIMDEIRQLELDGILKGKDLAYDSAWDLYVQACGEK
jgi:hypothetical protein